MEIPLRVKQHLGLDDARSWIVVTEGNIFEWPGYDLRRIGGTDRFDRGFLPPRLFDRVLIAFEAFHRGAAARITPRDQPETELDTSGEPRTPAPGFRA